MTGPFLLYLAIGKLAIWTLQRFFFDNRFKTRFVHKLFQCDLCLGTWVYVVLALFFKMTILQDVFPYVPAVSEAITGMTSSFLLHLLSLGWREKFSVIVV